MGAVNCSTQLLSPKQARNRFGWVGFSGIRKRFENTVLQTNTRSNSNRVSAVLHPSNVDTEKTLFWICVLGFPKPCLLPTWILKMTWNFSCQ